MSSSFVFPPPTPDAESEALSRPTGSLEPVPLSPLANPHVIGLASVDLFPESIPADASIGDVRLQVGRRLAPAVAVVNDRYFRFDLSQVDGAEETEVVEISEGWIPSVDPSSTTRKLMIIVPMVDPGAVLRWVVEELSKSGEVRRGQALVYPTYLWPRFEHLDGPVKVLVARAYGPAFR